MDTNDNKEAW